MDDFFKEQFKSDYEPEFGETELAASRTTGKTSQPERISLQAVEYLCVGQLSVD